MFSVTKSTPDSQEFVKTLEIWLKRWLMEFPFTNFPSYRLSFQLGFVLSLSLLVLRRKLSLFSHTGPTLPSRMSCPVSVNLDVFKKDIAILTANVLDQFGDHIKRIHGLDRKLNDLHDHVNKAFAKTFEAPREMTKKWLRVLRVSSWPLKY